VGDTPFVNRIFLGDCLSVLKELPDECIDACVTDPPYGLGNKEPTVKQLVAFLQGSTGLGPLKKGRKHCANSIVGFSVVPKSDDNKSESLQDFVTFRIVVPEFPVVPTGVVQLDNQASLGEQKVNGEGPVLQLNNVLVDEPHPKSGESFHHGKLCLRECKTFTGCVEVCRCFAQTGPTTFRVLVRLGHDSFGEAQPSPDVVTIPATEVRAVLTLDTKNCTGELSLAHGTSPLDSGLLLAAPEDVGARSGTRSLLATLQVFLAGEVGGVADGALTFEVLAPRALLDRFHTPRVAQKDFMGHAWEIPSVPVWQEVCRVLKPGGHVLAFGGTRTWDLISLGLRAAGFESRDTIADEFPALQWCQGMSMPKSLNVSKSVAKEGTPEALAAAKEWEGWGTGLKSSWEPIVVFRKPFEGTVTKNVLKHGTGAINIGATRVKHANREDFEKHKAQVEEVRRKGGVRGNSWKNASDLSGASEVTRAGRWPANLVLVHAPGCKQVGEDGLETANSWQCVEGCPVKALDEQSGYRLVGGPAKRTYHYDDNHGWNTMRGPGVCYAFDEGGTASRFFPQFEGAPFRYIPKVSKKEMSLGGKIENDHPTKKPVELMRWLVKLVCPKGGIVLDPYCGSGSTLHAAHEENTKYVGIERDPHAHEIATLRMDIVEGREQERRNMMEAFDIAMGLDDD
jgi:hypothetical protein